MSSYFDAYWNPEGYNPEEPTKPYDWSQTTCHDKISTYPATYPAAYPAASHNRNSPKPYGWSQKMEDDFNPFVTPEGQPFTIPSSEEVKEEQLGRSLKKLEEQGFVEEMEPGSWRLTPRGSAFYNQTLDCLLASVYRVFGMWIFEHEEISDQNVPDEFFLWLSKEWKRIGIE